MQLELHTPPPEPEEPEEEPEEVSVTHLGVHEHEQQEDYLTVKHITKIMFNLVNKLKKKHPILNLLNGKEIKK